MKFCYSLSRGWPAAKQVRQVAQDMHLPHVIGATIVQTPSSGYTGAVQTYLVPANTFLWVGADGVVGGKAMTVAAGKLFLPPAPLPLKLTGFAANLEEPVNGRSCENRASAQHDVGFHIERSVNGHLFSALATMTGSILFFITFCPRSWLPLA